MSGTLISMVKYAADTETRDISVERVLEGIRNGGKKLKGEIHQIRNRFEAELAFTGDREKAKLAVDQLKKQLPGVTWSGRFSYRASDKLLQHSGLLCADLDFLGDELPRLRERLQASPHLWALFISPTGDGLKAVFRVRADASKHAGSFRAVVQQVRELTGVQIDESGKDVARLCFLSFHPELYYNPTATALEPLPEPEKPKAAFNSNSEVNLSERQRIATELLGNIDWQSETSGFCACPGKHLHTTGGDKRDCKVNLDGAPNIYCFHGHCKGIEAGVNHELQSRVGKVERSARVNLDGNDKETPGPRKSAATELVQLAEEYAFFHDSQDRPFVRLEKNGHREIWPVESTKFRKLLARAYYKKMKKAINRNALADAVTTLVGKACHDGNEEPVFLRVAPHDGNILIDLCDEQWRVVEVTSEGWRILDESPVAFIRTGSMQALPEPIQGSGDIKPLWKLLNVSEAQRPLVTGSLLNAFDPEGPYFVTNYVGEHGTAKSSAARIERQLVDPSSNPLRSPPKEERDLIAQAASNRIVALDNLSYLPSWLSDAICRLATGGGHSARTLYTDLEEISLAVKRPVFLNGIEDVAVRPDLADRALQIELEEIPEENRMLEKVLWCEFDRHKTEIFSAILDALSCALCNLPKVKIKYLPRMADAVIWVTAGETAFGFKRGTFLKAYAKNLDESAAAAIELNPIGLAITQLLEKQDEWSGTPTELLEALGALVGEAPRREKGWPKNARSLGHALRRLAPALRRAGFDYQRPDREAKRRSIVLSKKCRDGKTSSQTSQTSFTKEEFESATSSQIVTESATSSQSPERNDNRDDHDDVFPISHDGDERAPEPTVGAPIESEAVDL